MKRLRRLPLLLGPFLLPLLSSSVTVAATPAALHLPLTDAFLGNPAFWMNEGWALSIYNSTDKTLTSPSTYLGFIASPSIIYNKYLEFDARFTADEFTISLRQTPGMVALTHPSASAYAVVYDRTGFHVVKYHDGVASPLGQAAADNMAGTYTFDSYHNFTLGAIDEGEYVRVTAIIDGTTVVNVLDTHHPVKSPATSYLSIQGPATPTLRAIASLPNTLIDVGVNYGTYRNKTFDPTSSEQTVIVTPGYTKVQLFPLASSIDTAVQAYWGRGSSAGTLIGAPHSMWVMFDSAQVLQTVTFTVSQRGYPSKDYVINVNRPLSSNCSLSSIATSSGKFVPDFDSATSELQTIYIADLDQSTQLTVTAADSTADIRAYHGNSSATGVASAPFSGVLSVTLDGVDETFVTFQVISQSGLSKDYPIRVKRLHPYDNTLEAVNLSNCTFGPVGFIPTNVDVQTIRALRDRGTCILTPVTAHPFATYRAFEGTDDTGVEIEPVGSGIPVPFDVGQAQRYITVRVDPPTNSLPRFYTFSIECVVTDDTLSRPAIYGVGEYLPVYQAAGVDATKIATLGGALGAQAFRMWMLTNELMLTYDTMSIPAVEANRLWIAHLEAGGVARIIGMNNAWFVPVGLGNGDLGAVPDRDLSADSPYLDFLSMYQTTWYTIAQSFPDVSYWEMGNEPNHDPFLHPLDYYPTMTHRFTMSEKAAITTDMMYHASLGIHAANPDAITVMPGLAPVDITGTVADMAGIASFLRLVYANIGSGDFGGGSMNSDDYFQRLAWHPYCLAQPDQNWVNANSAVYGVAVDNGDDGKKVLLTEFGYNDGGNVSMDRTQARWLGIAYSLIKSQMPYVETMNVYSMCGSGAVQFGLFSCANGNLTPKYKGLAIKEVFGGSGDIYRFAADPRAHMQGPLSFPWVSRATGQR